jgi:adenylate cyclase
MADVFVSYARCDKARVAPLVAAIEANGWTVWWDQEICSGQEFDRQIAQELKIASAVLVVWTRNSVESRWVRGEAREGAERGILVPVRFERADLPIDVRALHTTDFEDWKEDPRSSQAQEVMRALGTLIAHGRAPQSTTAISASGSAVHGAARAAICVLPFANMSGDPEQEYFSDGITEDIITDLSKISALSVTSRNSAFVFKGKHVDVTKVAHDLRVDHVLEGSVRKAGGRVRITAQLVNGSSNDHVWAERYDRDLNDIFALQDEISEAIVKALKLKLLPEERQALQQRGTENIEAYNLYLMARQLYITGHEGDARRAEGIVRLCARAAEIDSGYAHAWALLALGQTILRFLHDRGFENGLAAAERAIALDPTLGEAHAVKARVYSQDGRYDEASAEIDTALRLDPDSYEVNRSAAYLRYRQNRPGDAAHFFEKALTLMDTDVNSASMLISCYTALGNPAAVARVAELTLSRADALLKQDPNNAAAVGYGATALAALGQSQRFKEWMKRALLLDPDNIKSRYNFACALAAQLKETEAALELLESVFQNVSIGLLNHAKADPDLDSLRNNPKFAAMVKAAGGRLTSADEPGSLSAT